MPLADWVVFQLAVLFALVGYARRMHVSSMAVIQKIKVFILSCR